MNKKSSALEMAQVLAGLEIAIVSIADLLTRSTGLSHQAIAQHLQATADQLPKEAGRPTRRILEHIADGVMNSSPENNPQS